MCISVKIHFTVDYCCNPEFFTVFYAWVHFRYLALWHAKFCCFSWKKATKKEMYRSALCSRLLFFCSSSSCYRTFSSSKFSEKYEGCSTPSPKAPDMEQQHSGIQFQLTNPHKSSGAASPHEGFHFIEFSDSQYQNVVTLSLRIFLQTSLDV